MTKPHLEFGRLKENGSQSYGESRIEGAEPRLADRTPFLTAETLVMPQRRRFSTEYKLKILEEADRCTKPGELTALLRREGLYSSYLTAWRRQRGEGTLLATSQEQRGREIAGQQWLLDENKRLLRTNEELQTRLRQAEVTIEVQKKATEMVRSLLRTIDCDRP